jgi:hypothetical protein
MTETTPTLLGPVQILAVLLDEPKLDGRIIDEIGRLEASGTIVLIDAAVVVRESEDEFTAIDVDTELLPGRPLMGMVVGALLGLGAAGAEGAAAGAEAGAEAGIDFVASEDLMEFAEALPIGAAAGVAVFEQTWARTLMGAIRDSAGTILADDIIHAEDLVDLGIDLGLLAELADETE